MPILKRRCYCSYEKRYKTDKMIINMPVRFSFRLSQRNTTTGKYIFLTSHIGQMIFISSCFFVFFFCVFFYFRYFFFKILLRKMVLYSEIFGGESRFPGKLKLWYFFVTFLSLCWLSLFPHYFAVRGFYMMLHNL